MNHIASKNIKNNKVNDYIANKLNFYYKYILYNNDINTTNMYWTST